MSVEAPEQPVTVAKVQTEVVDSPETQGLRMKEIVTAASGALALAETAAVPGTDSGKRKGGLFKRALATALTFHELRYRSDNMSGVSLWAGIDTARDIKAVFNAAPAGISEEDRKALKALALPHGLAHQRAAQRAAGRQLHH